MKEDMFSVILNMHTALQEIDRVDGLVFPLLKLKDPFLMVPDAQTNEKLGTYVRFTERLIGESIRSTRKEL